MNLSITQEITGKKIIASYITEGNYVLLDVACYAEGDPALPLSIVNAVSNREDADSIEYYMVAYFREKTSDTSVVTICDQMRSTDASSGNGNGLVVAYNLYEALVMEVEPTKGDVKLGAGS